MITGCQWTLVPQGCLLQPSSSCSAHTWSSLPCLFLWLLPGRPYLICLSPDPLCFMAISFSECSQQLQPLLFSPFPELQLQLSSLPTNIAASSLCSYTTLLYLPSLRLWRGDITLWLVHRYSRHFIQVSHLMDSCLSITGSPQLQLLCGEQIVCTYTWHSFLASTL